MCEIIRLKVIKISKWGIPRHKSREEIENILQLKKKIRLEDRSGKSEVENREVRPLTSSSGQSLVEFAIVLPVLLLVVMGIIEFGLMMNSYLTLQNAAREGARAGALGSSNSAVESIIKTGSTGLIQDRIAVTVIPGDGSRHTGRMLTVKVTYNYNLNVPIINNIFANKTVPLQAEVSMRIE